LAVEALLDPMSLVIVFARVVTAINCQAKQYGYICSPVIIELDN
jgi:hypothetical protein